MKPLLKKIFGSNRFILFSLIIVIVICVPLSYTWYIYVSRHPIASSQSKNIYLFKPAVKFTDLQLINKSGVKLPDVQWKYKWILLYLAPRSCEQKCQMMLQKTKQAAQEAVLMYKKPIDMVAMSLYGYNDKEFKHILHKNFPNFIHVYVKSRNFNQVFIQHNIAKRARFEGMLFLVDPDGQIGFAFNNSANNADIYYGYRDAYKQYEQKS